MFEIVHFVGEVARRFRVPPGVVTNLFYRGLLDGAVCPVVSGRRVIPDHYLPEIARALAAFKGGRAVKEGAQ